MAEKVIPDDIRGQIEARVEQFNQAELGDGVGYKIRYRGKYLYLERFDQEYTYQVCRLAYNGAIDNWDFAIYKHSRNKYDPDDWFFPGTGHLDGTVEGAMRAGLEAYPPMPQHTPFLARVFRFLTGA